MVFNSVYLSKACNDLSRPMPDCLKPPNGTVMYVLQGMRPKPGPITDVFAGVMPFLGVYMLAVLLLMLFPGIATWLPKLMG